MQDLGIQVLFRGTNFLRLWQGLWVSLQIAAISMLFSVILGIFLGMIMTGKNRIV